MDAEIAAQINADFIPILSDREERPDLDLIYQGAAGAMRHQGGWPLNLFLTPDGIPYWVCGYQPREPQADAPSFRQVLTDTAKLWQTDKVRVAENAARVRAALEDLYNRDMAAPQENMNLDIAALRMGQGFDIFFGGITGAMKFPNAIILELLWRAFLRTGMPQFSQLIFTTLDSMLFGGLYDHVGGGFFRHTMDERWLEPSFEKMLYDNAQMIDILTQVWQFQQERAGPPAHRRNHQLAAARDEGGRRFRRRHGQRHPDRRRALLYLERGGDRRRPGRHLLGPLQAGLWCQPRRQSGRAQPAAPAPPTKPTSFFWPASATCC